MSESAEVELRLQRSLATLRHEIDGIVDDIAREAAKPAPASGTGDRVETVIRLAMARIRKLLGLSGQGAN